MDRIKISEEGDTVHQRRVSSAAGLLLSVAAAGLLSYGGLNVFAPSGPPYAFAHPMQGPAFALNPSLPPAAAVATGPAVTLASASVEQPAKTETNVAPQKPPVPKPAAHAAATPSPTPAPEPTGVHHLLHIGQTVATFVRKLRVEVTSYWANPAWSTGYTFTGIKAHRGVIAVDPRVIALGTYLYVPGYGFGRAEDTGGAIKGKHIDVFFKTQSKVDAWGLKYKTIYVLSGAPKTGS